MFRWQNIMRFVNKETLLEAHAKQSRWKATGVDGVTKDEYDVDVHGHIDRLCHPAVHLRKTSAKTA